MKKEKLFVPLSEARLPTAYGHFRMLAFEGPLAEMPHVVLTNLSGTWPEAVPVRIHSECMTGDVFGSLRCDCGEQLHASLRYLAEKGGVLIYLRQEGRGIGLINKLKAYQLQDEGLDTIAANHALGFASDERSFQDAVAILESLGIHRIHLLTNNPQKVEVFKGSSIQVEERIPLRMDAGAENEAYLRTKKDSMGHWL
jgi:3,4-dihydroxy 2-butanone 4-phosphate synthase / GTP cyclohydrolase II